MNEYNKKEHVDYVWSLKWKYGILGKYSTIDSELWRLTQEEKEKLFAYRKAAMEQIKKEGE